MEITKVYREHLPKSKLAGKRYTNRDRDESGTFARHWQACFREDWPAALRPGIIAEMGDSLVGAMRM
ncbi:MAG: hypothetical protein LIO87_06730, partial [Eubacterium sp.]|nr:hypothetical protein [Eubacterium sp.]